MFKALIKNTTLTVCLWLSINANSQTYTFSPNNPFIFLIDTMAADYTERGIEVVNTGTINLNLTWTQFSVDTTDMSLDFCNSGNCYTGLPQSGAMPTIPPGGKGWLKYHVFSKRTTGSNTVKYILRNGTQQTDTLTTIFIVGKPTGIKEIKNNKTVVSIYPNPACDNIFADLKVEKALMEIYNFNGSRILSSQLTKGVNKLDLKGLTNGVYFYKITGSNGEEKLEKIFISR